MSPTPSLDELLADRPAKLRSRVGLEDSGCLAIRTSTALRVWEILVAAVAGLFLLIGGFMLMLSFPKLVVLFGTSVATTLAVVGAVLATVGTLTLSFLGVSDRDHQLLLRVSPGSVESYEVRKTALLNRQVLESVASTEVEADHRWYSRSGVMGMRPVNFVRIGKLTYARGAPLLTRAEARYLAEVVRAALDRDRPDAEGTGTT